MGRGRILEVSSDYLEEEIEHTEKKLQALEKRQQNELQHDEQKQDDYEDTRDTVTNKNSLPKDIQLAQLGDRVESLVLTQSLLDWIKDVPEENDEATAVIAKAKWCCSLGSLLMDHSDSVTFQETYIPLYEYIFSALLSMIRNELEAKTADDLIHQCQFKAESSAFAQGCLSLFQLQTAHQTLLQDESLNLSPSMILAKELIRPFLQRITFHFVERSPDRMTTTRVDRLPEWLVSYVKENLIDDGPQSLIQLGLSSVLENVHNLNICFCEELVKMIEWVLLERQFFRHLEVCGPRSNPIYMMNAMEQFLIFDQHLRTLIGHEVRGLMDTFVMVDDELRQWFIERERERVFTTLFEDDSNVPKPLANHVSPRAEVFCALIRSVQWKASILTEPGIYLRQVAVPLCSQFVDALQETANELRNLMCHPSGMNLSKNIQEWIEIINGTRLASRVLLKEGAWQDGMPATSQSDHDLAEFGKSLARLVDVMIEEVASSFVETLLTQQAKFGLYLIHVSRLLASPGWEDNDDDDDDLSADLQQSQDALKTLRKVCHSIIVVPGDVQEAGDSLERETAQFAPIAIEHHVMTRVADKLLDVVMDVHDSTPDLWLNGSETLSQDVTNLFGNTSKVASVQRLFEVLQLMTTPSYESLVAALGGLVGAMHHLDINNFSSDEMIYDEALLMLRAKGFTHIELKDALSILNRRRD